MSYNHLTYFDRFEIELSLRRNVPRPEIAQSLGRDACTVYREIARNRGANGQYRALEAQVAALHRRRASKRQPSLAHGPLRRYVESKLREDWSPEQIAGRLPLDFADDDTMRVSHETIYLYVYADKRRGGDLYTHLRHGHKKRRKRGGAKSRRGLIPGRVSIDQRPKVVELQGRHGDWEADTLFGRQRQRPIATFTERATLYTAADLMADKRADSLNRAAIGALAAIPDAPIHTITVDNGKEFAGFKDLEKALDVDIYFARPYTATDRAINENLNGLIRQYLPKKSDFAKLTRRQLQTVIRKLNNRPRKKLGYRTPNEALLGAADALQT